MAKILFGPAGNSGFDLQTSVKRVKEAGLGSQEVEFVRGVYLSNEKAKEAGKTAKELGIRLSIHAPYYINLVSLEQDKIGASKKRILDSCERGFYLGVRDVVFHAGYYGKREKQDVYDMIKKEIVDMQSFLKKKDFDSVRLAPETTGKKSQFGSLEELLRLRKEIGCSICVDFAHLLARNGSIDYADVFRKLLEAGLKQLHCHFSGIIYGEKGEQKHRLIERDDLEPLLKEALKHDIELNIIIESPDPFGDALKCKRIYEEIKTKHF